MKIFRIVFNYLRLYRPDAAGIAFGGFLAGTLFVKRPEPYDFLLAGLVALLSMNFCYSVNSWTDWRADRMNKPKRPIPNGSVPPSRALFYSLFLLAGSLVYPFLLARTVPAALLLLALPVLGALYSLKPFRLKKRPPFSLLTVAAGLTIPFAAGYENARPDWVLAWFFVVIVLFTTSLVGLKDIGDSEGDQALGDPNLHSRMGSRLLDASVAGLAATGVLAALLPMPGYPRAWLLALTGCEAALILFYRIFGRDPRDLYMRVILLVAVFGAALFIRILRLPPGGLLL